jgi:glycosyltransferase involved in cell wall biosynthesis
VSDRPLRVAVVGRSIYGLHRVGGLERALYELVRHHLADGWDVTLITRPADGDAANPDAWRALASHSNFTLRTVPYRTFPFAGRRGTTVADRSTAYPLFGYRAGQDAARLVAQGRIDLVHSAGASGFGYAHAHQVAGGPRAPLVLNPHGLEEFGDAHGQFAGHPLKGLAYAPLRRVVRATAAAADAVIATDAALRPVVVRHLGVDPARVHVIPNGLDLVKGAGRVDVTEGRALRQAQGIDPGDTVLLSVGRLEVNKGYLDLVQALVALRETRWRWVLIGDGPDRQEIEDALDRAALRDRAQIVGRVDDSTLHAWYDAADLFVHPTRYEGSSIVTLEAMLHQTPVVATRVGGLPDKVIPGRTGWLAEGGDAGSLTSALREALVNRHRWQEFGRAARALLEERFDWRVIQRQYAGLYGRLLGKTKYREP